MVIVIGITCIIGNTTVIIHLIFHLPLMNYQIQEHMENTETRTFNIPIHICHNY